MIFRGPRVIRKSKKSEKGLNEKPSFNDRINPLIVLISNQLIIKRLLFKLNLLSLPRFLHYLHNVDEI